MCKRKFDSEDASEDRSVSVDPQTRRVNMCWLHAAMDAKTVRRRRPTSLSTGSSNRVSLDLYLYLHLLIIYPRTSINPAALFTACTIKSDITVLCM